MKIEEVKLKLESMGLPSSTETIRRWIRKGELKATLIDDKKKNGYNVDIESFQDLVKKKLIEKHKRHLVYQKGYKDGFEDAQKLYEKTESEEE